MKMIRKNKIINEATRRELETKSKVAQKTKTYGTTRYERKKYSSIASSNRSYNNIDMNALFKGDILSFKVPVKGETNNYEVELLFENFLEYFRNEIEHNNYKVDFRTAYRALQKSINSGDIYISCSCPDWKYRMAYWSTKNSQNSGAPEVRASDITNPDDKLGSGCKHSMLVLSNIKWAIKVASVIANYISYIKKNRKDLYNKIIKPAIFEDGYDPNEDDEDLDNAMDNDNDRDNIDKIMFKKSKDNLINLS